MTYNNSWLIERADRKDKLDFLFFWGHQPSKDGAITASCFSQWWVSPFEVEGVCYNTAEHWMMAAKARLFNDRAICEKIIAAKSPAEVKKLGRMIEGFNGAIWDANKYQIVTDGNYYKFSQKTDLKKYLLQTEEKIIVEASPVDAIWGIGMATDNPQINNPKNWKGENLLGYALMEVRDQLK